jgi:hypothetical protein
MRALGLVGLLCVACTRPNPAFDGDAATAGEDVGPDTVDPDTVGSGLDTVGPVTAGSSVGTLGPDDTVGQTTAAEDLPVDSECDQQPSAGLSIQLGDPAMLGVCPPSMAFSMRVIGFVGNEVFVAQCSPGCGDCPTSHPLSVDFVPLADILPAKPCLELEAEPLVMMPGASRCHWGALTIYDPMADHPYVIATSRSDPPTPTGGLLLAGAVPEPLPGPVCTCASIGQENDCCLAGDPPPTFWHYTIGAIQVAPGEEAPIVLETGVAHSFHLFQAEHIATCQNHPRQLSWAVTPAP